MSPSIDYHSTKHNEKFILRPPIVSAIFALWQRNALTLRNLGHPSGRPHTEDASDDPVLGFAHIERVTRFRTHTFFVLRRFHLIDAPDEQMESLLRGCSPFRSSD